MKSNENIEICSRCGGHCCNHYSGAYAPEDFKTDGKLTEEELRAILTREENPVSIDWLDGDIQYFLRPRHIGGDICDPSFGGKCVNLNGDHCVFDFEHRPRACRELEPGENGCTSCGERVGKLDKEVYVEWWSDYQDILDKLSDEYDKGTHTGGLGINPFYSFLSPGLEAYLRGGFGND